MACSKWEELIQSCRSGGLQLGALSSAKTGQWASLIGELAWSEGGEPRQLAPALKPG